LSRHASVITALPDMIATTVRGFAAGDRLDETLVFRVQRERVPVAAVGACAAGCAELRAAEG